MFKHVSETCHKYKNDFYIKTSSVTQITVIVAAERQSWQSQTQVPVLLTQWVLQCYSVTVLQCYNVTVLQCYIFVVKMNNIHVSQ